MRSKRLFQFILFGLVLALMIVLFKKGNEYTSTNQYCNSCHVHDHAHSTWMTSVHHSKDKIINCVDCHLPPKAQGFYSEKIKAGFRDIYAFYLRDSATYNWQQKSLPEYARLHTFETSCIQCHPKLFPVDLSKNGETAHWHYTHHRDELHCVDCHINVGHGNRQKPSHNYQFHISDVTTDTIYDTSAEIRGLNSFAETIPGSDIAFEMVAVNGGEAILGTNENKTVVNLSPFFIGRAEVSWDEYLLFLRETESEGRSENDLDAISGATPPWGNPDQGWGMGKRPAITMTHHAATVYCQWLSDRTGKHYRLPTEAEWEYAAQIAYRGIDDVNEYVSNVKSSTVEPDKVKADNLGLKHLFGNVKEFCADTFTENGYKSNGEFLENPLIHLGGKNHVVKGGSFRSSSDSFKPAYRESTQHDQWLKTDPQIPKSIWWYSDCNDVGFRIVLTYQESK